jgi:hypothetical protein
VGAEIGIAGNLNAIRDGFGRFFRGGMLARFRGKHAAVAKAQQAPGEDAGDLVGAIFEG